MRFFRIPSFTGIEAHRDDADRGSLRMVEGCLPHGPGGLRSGPVWKKIGEVSKYSTTDSNNVTAADDGQGNSLLFVSRDYVIHDLAVISEENTEIKEFGGSYNVAIPEASLYEAGPASLTPIGNRIYAVGDGSSEAMFVGKGPDDTFEVFPDEDLYSQEWSRFPQCQYFVQGPKKTIFAAGNPAKPLTVYISEPAGLTSPYRDTPYSTEDTTYNQGVLSTVDILGSNASKITALSTRGDQVVVHTDKGCHLLYAPAPDQASTGYRVEQAPATNFSAAVNSKVVSRASGALTYWIGHDGQVYKDEAASRGSEDLRSRADEDQANWKSKGIWEHEHPTDLSQSFAVYSPQSGDYIFFVEAEEYDKFAVPEPPHNLRVVEPVEWGGAAPVFWRRTTYTPCTDTDPDTTHYCCKPTSKETDNTYATFKECSESTLPYYEIGLCESLSDGSCGPCVNGKYELTDDCECVYSPGITGCPIEFRFQSLESCQIVLDIYAGGVPGERCSRWDIVDCECVRGSIGPFTSSASCQEALEQDPNCITRYEIFPDHDPCSCVLSTNGSYESKESCEAAIPEGCGDGGGGGAIETYELVDCNCTPSLSGTLSESECLARRNIICFEGEDTCCETWEALGFASIDECKTTDFYKNEERSYCKTSGGSGVYGTCDGLPSDHRSDCSGDDCSDCGTPVWEIDNCQCSEIYSDEALGTTYQTQSACEEALAGDSGCVLYTLDTVNCSCSSTISSIDPDNSTTFADLSSCEAALDLQCLRYNIQDCQCVEDPSGAYRGTVNCEAALPPDCAPHWLVNCNCTSTDPQDGTPSFPGFFACAEALDQTIECNCDSSDRRYNTFVDEGIWEGVFYSDTFCLDAGSGSGQFTECECIELGHTII